MKSPELTRLSEYTLHDGGLGVYSIYIKAVAPAKTTPLYTKSIVRREPIAFINALVSPMRCEYVPGLWKYIKKINRERKGISIAYLPLSARHKRTIVGRKYSLAELYLLPIIGRMENRRMVMGG